MTDMKGPLIQFKDGARYERYMGRWSQQVGQVFLDWLDPPPGWRWLDIGCGNGAFTEMLAARCAPASLHGLDPSEEQLAYARARPALAAAQFQLGHAMALPFADAAFDAAVMPLVIFFVPDPAKGLTEMVRVVAPGGMVCAYAWDMLGGGFPYHALHCEMRAMGIEVPAPPSAHASRVETMRAMWREAGLVRVETRHVQVRRTFDDFEDYWSTAQGAPSVGPRLATLPAADIDRLRARMKCVLPVDAEGRVELAALANAVKGRVAG